MEKTTHAAFVVYVLDAEGDFLRLGNASTHEDATEIANDFIESNREEGMNAPFAGCYIVPATFIPAHPEEYATWSMGE